MFNVATQTLNFILFVCQNYDLQDFCQCMNKYIVCVCVCVLQCSSHLLCSRTINKLNQCAEILLCVPTMSDHCHPLAISNYTRRIQATQGLVLLWSGFLLFSPTCSTIRPKAKQAESVRASQCHI